MDSQECRFETLEHLRPIERLRGLARGAAKALAQVAVCLLYTSDAADEHRDV